MKFFNLMIAIFFVLLISSCKKDDSSESLVVSTSAVSSITENSAVCGGVITSNGENPITDCGVCWSTSASPTVLDSKTSEGDGLDLFYSVMTNLVPNTTYHVRAYAVSAQGVKYGQDISFKTLAYITLTTSPVSVMSTTSVISGGNITSDAGSTVTSRGVCWSTSSNPSISNSKTSNGVGAGAFESSISGLTINTVYYLRAYATNDLGTFYGNEVTFGIWLNQPDAPITDIDGNVYHTVKIGGQVWTVENLKTTKYRNGDPIQNITSNDDWSRIPIGNYSLGAYCNYNNDIANVAVYGRLYNWHAVINSKNLCPQGWHVPSEAEWAKLRAFLGEWSLAGGKMKESGTIHWIEPNTGATNESGFTGLPGGFRFSDASFQGINSRSAWWSITEFTTTPTTHAIDVELINSDVKFHSYAYPKNCALAVRCIKD